MSKDSDKITDLPAAPPHAGGQAALDRRMSIDPDIRNRSITGAVLWALQAAIGTIQQLGPGTENVSPVAVYSYLALTLTMSVICLVAGPRLSAKTFEVAEKFVVLFGWLAAAWLVAATGGAASADLGLFANVMFYCAYFMNARWAAINVALGTLLMWTPLVYDHAIVGATNFVSRALVMTTVLWAMVLLIAHNRRMTQRAELAARRLALTDPLTGVANLRTFNEEFQRELDRAQADGKPLGVAFVDLNGLKATNTVHGHAGGDRLICGTAEALLSVSGEGDQVARVGGDEFAVLVPGGTSGQMKELESRFAVALSEQSLNGQRGPLELSASIGSAVHPQDGATADQLMQVADRRMYDSKAALPSRFPTPGTAGGRALSEQPIEGSSSSATMIASGAPAASLAWLLAAAMIATGAASTGAADVHPRFAFLLTGVCFVVAGVLAFTHDARRQRASNIANGLAVGIAIPAIWATGGAAAPILPLAYLVVANAAYALSPRAAVLQTGAMMGILVAVLISNVETAHAAGASVILGEVLVIAALLRFNRMRADAAEHEALELSRIDPLTRLANRRVFERSLAVASQERISRGTQEHDRGGLILIDVDNFKTINSSGGHRTGDEVLRMIAAVLEGAAGSDALVCRIGGDEFAVVVPEGDQSSLLRLAAKCRAAIGAVDWHVLCEPEVTISAGVASWELVDDWKEIVVAADLAMRLSKDSGRNAVSAAPERPVETHRPAADAV